MRSPNTGNANNVRNVNTDGQVSNNNARNANAAAPDCVYSRLRVNRKIEIRAFRQGTVNLSRKGKLKALMRAARLSGSRYPNAGGGNG